MVGEVDLDTSIGYELKRVQHALRLAMDGEVRELGLTTPQYAALSILERDEELSGAELARRCFVTPQTMNGVLTTLESAGRIERRAHPTHGQGRSGPVDAERRRVARPGAPARYSGRGAHGIQAR